MGYNISYAEDSIRGCRDKNALKEKLSVIINQSTSYIENAEEASELIIVDEKHKLYLKFVKVDDRIVVLDVQENIHIVA